MFLHNNVRTWMFSQHTQQDYSGILEFNHIITAKINSLKYMLIFLFSYIYLRDIMGPEVGK